MIEIFCIGSAPGNDSATNAIVRQYSFTTGKATPQGGVLNTVKGYWKFDKGNLKANVGQDLHYLDNSVVNLYEFGTTGQGAFAAIPNINGKPDEAAAHFKTALADKPDFTEARQQLDLLSAKTNSPANGSTH